MSIANLVIDPGGWNILIEPSDHPKLTLSAPDPARTLTQVLEVGGVRPLLLFEEVRATVTRATLERLTGLVTEKNLERWQGTVTPTPVHWFFSRFTERVSGTGVQPTVAPVVSGTTPTWELIGVVWRVHYYPVITGWLEVDQLGNDVGDRLIDVVIKIS